MTEQVAQTLKDSGLFDKLLNQEYIRLIRKYREPACGDHPNLLTADQAEAILANMEQAKNSTCYVIDSTGIMLRYVDPEGKDQFLHKNEGNLTFKLNSILAQCCGVIKTELERAIEGVK